MYRILTAADYKQTPWKNGKGVTDEILISPSVAKFPQDSFDWRLSSASLVESGAFSIFPDFDRILTLVEGTGLKLLFSNHDSSVILETGESHFFKGEEVVFASLSRGPIRDLNFIVRRGLNFDFKILRLTREFVKVPYFKTQIYYVIESELELLGDTSGYLAEGETLALDEGEQNLQIRARHGTTLVASISIGANGSIGKSPRNEDLRR